MMTEVTWPLSLRADCSLDEVQQLCQFLEKQGTFRFPTLANGLFSAAAGDGDELQATGYHNVWVRDNIHIAHAHWRWGEPDKAVRALKSLMTFYVKHRHRFVDIIEGKVDPSEPMNRPHVRFDGDHLVEIDQKWSHAQNDALGAFLWLSARMKAECRWNAEEMELLTNVARFLHAVHYWQDEDSGHWEEVRKVASSSIGVATAALDAWGERFVTWAAAGRSALKEMLPAECIQSDPLKQRRYDAALLFLIYPYQIVTGPMADRIVADVCEHLMGDYGIRRYLGDSYWCADYKDKLSANVRTSDFSDDLSARDRLLEPGFEAQWCLFDPIISIHYGLRFERTGLSDDRCRQIHHLNRSLGQLTPSGSRFGAFRCPESYYCERGRYVPNDICPLLWTQANLKLALTKLIEALKTGKEKKF